MFVPAGENLLHQIRKFLSSQFCSYRHAIKSANRLSILSFRGECTKVDDPVSLPVSVATFIDKLRVHLHSFEIDTQSYCFITPLNSLDDFHITLAKLQLSSHSLSETNEQHRFFVSYDFDNYDNFVSPGGLFRIKEWGFVFVPSTNSTTKEHALLTALHETFLESASYPSILLTPWQTLVLKWKIEDGQIRGFMENNAALAESTKKRTLLVSDRLRDWFEQSTKMKRTPKQRLFDAERAAFSGSLVNILHFPLEYLSLFYAPLLVPSLMPFGALLKRAIRNRLKNR